MPTWTPTTRSINPATAIGDPGQHEHADDPRHVIPQQREHGVENDLNRRNDLTTNVTSSRNGLSHTLKPAFPLDIPAKRAGG